MAPKGEYVSGRQIDQRVSSASRKLGSRFVLLPSAKIKTWKALVIIMFVAGFLASIVWAIDGNRLLSPFEK